MNNTMPSNTSHSLPLAVAPVVPSSQVVNQAAETDIRGIRGPVEIPPVQDWQPWMLGALAALLVIVAVSYWIRSARRRAAMRVLSACEQALADLQKTRELMEQSSSREYAYAVSDVLRGFLEMRFALPSTRRTTDEFLQSIAKNGAALGPYKTTLCDFLNYCDLGKFGKWQLSQNEMNALHQSAVSVIKAELEEAFVESKKEPTSSVAEEASAVPA